MISHTTEEFRRRLEALPAEVRLLARKNYVLWRRNPQHPSIRFKPVGGSVWSARVGLAYRALAAKDGNAIIWYWIGHHTEYDALLRGK